MTLIQKITGGSPLNGTDAIKCNANASGSRPFAMTSQFNGLGRFPSAVATSMATFSKIRVLNDSHAAELIESLRAEVERLRALVSDDTLQQIGYIRNSAIEECAKVAENAEDMTYSDVAAAIRALKEKPMMQHSLRRTSPKRGPFLGTCVNCGTPNLTFEQSREECPNQRGVSQEDAIIEAVRDDRNDTLQQVGYIRNSAIEECAQELEIRGRSDLAAAIRALKDKS